MCRSSLITPLVVWMYSDGKQMLNKLKKTLFHEVTAIRRRPFFKLILIVIVQVKTAFLICFSWARTKQGSVLLHKLGVASPGQREVYAIWHWQTAVYAHCVRLRCAWPWNSASEAARRVDGLRQRYDNVYFGLNIIKFLNVKFVNCYSINYYLFAYFRNT